MSAPIGLQIVIGFLLFASIFIPLERCFPRRKQDIFRVAWLTDLAYYVAGCVTGRYSDAMSVGTVLLIGQLSGENSARLAASQPGLLQFCEIVVIADFLSYWCHRFVHKNGLLWRFHSIHHSSQHMDWLANARLHPIDKVLGDFFQFIPIFSLGFGNGPILAYTIFLGFQTFLNHSNIRLNFGPLRWIIANPQFHHWHHCNDPAAYNKNFAPHLVIFDLIFGTAYFPGDRSLPETYGVAEPMPETFLGQMLYPFRCRPSEPEVPPVPQRDRDSSGLGNSV